MITYGMLGKAFVAAQMTTTEYGCSKGGWLRLAKVTSRSDRPGQAPYVVAIRATNSDVRPFQFGCSCPDWIYRHRSQRHVSLCKHQRELLARTGGSSPTKGIWLFKAGAAAFESLRQNMTAE